MPEELDAILELQNLGISLVLDAVVHNSLLVIILATVLVVIIVLRVITILTILVLHAIIGVISQIQCILFRVICLVDILKFFDDVIFFLIKCLNDIVGGHAANK